MTNRKTSTVRKPRTLKTRPVAIEGRSHKCGGLTLAVGAMNAAHRKHAIELQMGGCKWWPEVARALGQGAA